MFVRRVAVHLDIFTIPCNDSVLKGVFCCSAFGDSSHVVTSVKEGMSFSKPSGTVVVLVVVVIGVIRSQARKMVFSVYNFFKKCKFEEERNWIFQSAKAIMAEAFGVSTKCF